MQHSRESSYIREDDEFALNSDGEEAAVVAAPVKWSPWLMLCLVQLEATGPNPPVVEIPITVNTTFKVACLNVLDARVW